MSKSTKKKWKSTTSAKTASLLAASLSISPLLPLVPIHAAITPDPIRDFVGIPGEKVTIDLQHSFGVSSGTFNIAAVGANQIVDVHKEGHLLHLYLNAPGSATFSVTLSEQQQEDKFTVRVMDLGADGKFDAGDLTRFIHQNPGVIESKEQAVNAIVNKVAPAKVEANRPPVPAASVTNHVYSLNYNADTGFRVPLAALFKDEDGDELTYHVVPASMSGLTASTQDGIFSLTGVPVDRSAFTIAASDPKGAFSKITIIPNNPPVLAVPSVTHSVYSSIGQVPEAVQLNSLFKDIDQDPLQYSVTDSTYGQPHAVIVNNERIVFEGLLREGKASYLITAMDPKGASASLTYIIDPDLFNSSPVPVVSEYRRTFNIGEPIESLNASALFADADQDELTYSIETIRDGGLTVTVQGSHLHFSGKLEGDAHFLVTASDGQGGTAQLPLIFSGNHAPAPAQPYYDLYYLQNSTIEETQLDLHSLFTDPDEGDQALLQFELDEQSSVIPAGLQVTLSGSTLTYSGELGTNHASLNVRAFDNKGAMSYVQIRLKPNYLPGVFPEAKLQAVYTEGQSAPIAVDLSTLFYDGNGDNLFYSITPEESNGLTAAIDEQNILTFTLNGESFPNYTPAVFTITASDHRGGTVSAEFTVMPNRAPQANPEIELHPTYHYSVNEYSSAWLGDLEHYFTDEEGFEALQITIAPSEFNGMRVYNDGGLFIEGKPEDPTAGPFVFTITATDEHNQSASLTFTVTPNQIPVVNPEAPTNLIYHFNENGSPFVLASLDDYFEDDAAGMNFWFDITEYNGMRIFREGSLLKMEGTPINSQEGPFTFTVYAEDSNGETAEVTLSVITNSLPIINSDAPNHRIFYYTDYSSPTHGPYYIPFILAELNHYLIDDSGSLTFSFDATAQVNIFEHNGMSLIIDGNRIMLHGKPSELPVEPFTVIVTATDAQGGKIQLPLTVTPAAVPTEVIHYTMGEDDLSVDLSSLVNPDADPASVKFIQDTPVPNGFWGTVAGNTFVITKIENSETDYALNAEFVITSKDEYGAYAVKHIVVDPNRAPVLAGGSTQSVFIESDGTHTIEVSSLFEDADDDVLEITVDPQQDYGITAASDGSTITFTVGDEGFFNVDNGTAQFNITAMDAAGTTASLVYTLIPDAKPRAYSSTLEDYFILGNQTYITIDMNDTFYDPFGDTLTYTADITPENSGLTLFESGNLIFIESTREASEPVTITLKAQDSSGQLAEAVLTLTPNHAPSLTSEVYNLYYEPSEGMAEGTIELDQFFSDIDGDLLSYSYEDQSERFTVTITDHLLSYSGDLGASAGTFFVIAHDGKNGSRKLTVNVYPNETPQVLIAEAGIHWAQGTTVWDPIDLYDLFDNGGAPLTFDVTTEQGSSITATVNHEGRLTLALDSSSYILPDETSVITIRASNEQGLTSESAAITIALAEEKLYFPWSSGQTENFIYIPDSKYLQGLENPDEWYTSVYIVNEEESGMTVSYNYEAPVITMREGASSLSQGTLQITAINEYSQETRTFTVDVIPLQDTSGEHVRRAYDERAETISLDDLFPGIDLGQERAYTLLKANGSASVIGNQLQLNGKLHYNQNFLISVTGTFEGAVESKQLVLSVLAENRKPEQNLNDRLPNEVYNFLGSLHGQIYRTDLSLYFNDPNWEEGDAPLAFTIAGANEDNVLVHHGIQALIVNDQLIIIDAGADENTPPVTFEIIVTDAENYSVTVPITVHTMPATNIYAAMSLEHASYYASYSLEDLLGEAPDEGMHFSVDEFIPGFFNRYSMDADIIDNTLYFWGGKDSYYSEHIFLVNQYDEQQNHTVHAVRVVNTEYGKYDYYNPSVPNNTDAAVIDLYPLMYSEEGFMVDLNSEYTRIPNNYSVEIAGSMLILTKISDTPSSESSYTGEDLFIQVYYYSYENKQYAFNIVLRPEGTTTVLKDGNVDYWPEQAPHSKLANDFEYYLVPDALDVNYGTSRPSLDDLFTDLFDYFQVTVDDVLVYDPVTGAASLPEEERSSHWVYVDWTYIGNVLTQDVDAAEREKTTFMLTATDDNYNGSASAHVNVHFVSESEVPLNHIEDKTMLTSSRLIMKDLHHRYGVPESYVFSAFSDGDIKVALINDGKDLVIETEDYGHDNYITIIGTNPATGKGFIDQFFVNSVRNDQFMHEQFSVQSPFTDSNEWLGDVIKASTSHPDLIVDNVTIEGESLIFDIQFEWDPSWMSGRDQDSTSAQPPRYITIVSYYMDDPTKVASIYRIAPGLMSTGG